MNGPMKTGSDLQHSLNDLVRARAHSNSAFSALLDDYTKYHAVLAVLGALLALSFVVLGIFCWKRYRRAPKAELRPRFVERKSYLFFGLLSTVIAALMTLVALANLSNVLHPRDGIADAVPTFKAAPGTETARIHQVADRWLRSGTAETPAQIQHQIDERLSWQRPKAIICGVLFVVLAALWFGIWGKLLARSKRRPRDAPWRLKEGTMTAGWVALAAPILVLMVMAVANTQASFAPLTLTLLYG
jgi:hypothetical protein